MTYRQNALRDTLRDRSVVVVGGGVGGLAAAVRLACRGARVTLFEQQPRVGGKLNQRVVVHPDRRDDSPFRFDTGPSLLTLPLVLADLFFAAREDVRDHIDLIRLDPISKFVWPDGQTLTTHGDPDVMVEQVRRLAPEDVDGWCKLMNKGRGIWEIAGEDFLGHAPEQLLKRPGPPWKGLSLLSVPLRIGMHRRLGPVVDKFVKHPRLRAMLYQYATYGGGSPWGAPAALLSVPHVELGLGGFYVKGGMYRIAEALLGLAERLGVEVRTSAAVEKVIVSDAASRGVVVDGKEHIADAVIVNADAVTAYRNLIAPADRPHRTDQQLASFNPGGSGMACLLGTDRRFGVLEHHTKFMPDDYEAELRAMFDAKRIPGDPCIYVCASTRSDPTQAPTGCENLFVLSSAPSLWGGGEQVDWSNNGQAYRDRLVARLEQFGMTGLADSVVVEDRFTPPRLESEYAANAGSIYGIGVTSRRQSFLRPPNRDPKIKGLFLAGTATHPGGGIPLVAMSGKIAAELCAEGLGDSGR
ncbi:MAG: phytoene desaturase family protein [Planctomycetota bacterium]